MRNVIDVVDDEADELPSVLTETGSGGVLGREYLHDDPVVANLDDDESVRFLLRNKKSGFELDGDGERPETVSPDSSYSAFAVVTDARLLFLVGQEGGDRTASVPFEEVVVARADQGMLGSALVVSTVADEQYRFPCRGDVDPVQSYVDWAATVWTRTLSLVDGAEAALDRARDAFESGDTDATVRAVADARESIADAREEAADSPAALAAVEERAEPLRERANARERRALVNLGEQARERARAHWDDNDFEQALDRLEDADEAFEQALTVDALEPTDGLIRRRRESLTEERDRLVEAPRTRATNAVEAAELATDPETTAEWYERALDRYEDLLSLDWGRDSRRFAGDPGEIREQLATVAGLLVEARCDVARKRLEAVDAGPADPDYPDDSGDCDDVQSTLDAAETALDRAAVVADERAPDATGEVERLRADLAEARERDRDRDADESDADETDDTPGAGHPDEGAFVFGDERAGKATSEEPVPADESTPPADVPPESLPSLVGAVFEAHGWSSRIPGLESDRRYDLLVRTDGPVEVSVAVWTVHPAETGAVERPDVERYAAFLDQADEADVGAVAGAVPLTNTARDRAADLGLRVLDAETIAAGLDRSDLGVDSDGHVVTSSE